MIYTEDREQFERDMLCPGRFARLQERAARYIDGLTEKDKNAFLEVALDYMWEHRGEVRSEPGLVSLWNKALEVAAYSRPRWLVTVGHHGVATHKVWCRGQFLGRR